MTRHRSDWLTRSWLQRGALAWLLRPVAAVYQGLVAIRRAAYARGWLAQQRLPVPVVVIGNVVVGGAGKTPTVVAVVQHLQRQGHHPGVISRGYGRDDPEQVREVRPDTPANLSGDEPALIRQATGAPVFVGRQRAQAGMALLAAYPHTTVLVCDDGLQHLALATDVGVAVFDERGAGNGWLLPAGLLREPWPPSAPSRVDLVLHAMPQDAGAATHTSPNAPLPPAPGLPVFRATKRLAAFAVNAQGERVALSELAHQPLSALAGIAKPEVFFSMLRNQGLTLADTWALADHQSYDDFLNSKLFNEYERKALIFTEKDAVKIFPELTKAAARHSSMASPPPARPAWAVPLCLDIEPAFFAALDERLSSKNGHQIA